MGIKVLLVDDEKDFADALAQRLEIRGFSMKVAYSGDTAIEILSGNDMDVVIMDIKMPGMEGIEALERVKSMNPLIEVVMLTAHGSLGEAIRTMKIGAHDFLMKPAPIDDIIEKITAAAEIKAAHEERIRKAQAKANNKASD